MTRLARIVGVSAVAGALALSVTSGVAWASWSADSAPGGAGSAAATSVGTGAKPTVLARAGAVTVSWAAARLTSGDPVEGYLVRRYDAATLVQQTLSAGCAGLRTATACTEDGVADGQWVYRVTPVIGNWSGAEGPASDPVATDSTAPVNTVSVLSVDGNATRSGPTVFYRGVAAGSFTLQNTVLDSASGPASSTTAALAGNSAGWIHDPSTVSSPASGPYVSTFFSWSAGTTSEPTEVVTGRDLAGNSADTALVFVDDSTPPGGGSISYADGFQPGPSVSVTLNDGTDSGAGIARRQLQRSGASLVGGVCGTFTGFADRGPDGPASPYLDTQVENGTCYRYRYVVSDGVGNQSVIGSPDTAEIDSAAGGPALGTAGAFSVLGGTGVANTLATIISGDLGVSPSSSVTGFPPGTVAGTTHAGDPTAAAAQSDLASAYLDATARVPTAQFSGDQNGRTYHPGVFHTAAAFALTGTLTLDGQGDPNSLFVFQIGAALNTAASSKVELINGAQASHVFWSVDGAVGTGALSTFAGTLMAQGAITLGAGAQLIGRALCQGLITLADNDIRFTDALPPVVAIDGGTAAETKDSTPTITGTTDAASGAVVTVGVAGQNLTTEVQGDGTWSVTTAALAAGAHVVTARVRDAAGNAGSATQTLSIEINPDPVLFNAAGSFSVLAGTNVVGTGISALAGSLGVSPGTSVTGFPPGTADEIHAGDEPAAEARFDLVRAYDDALGRVPSSEFSGDQKGKTLHEGVHHTSAAFALSGTLTLDAQADPDAVFIIQIAAALNTAAASRIVLTNGAQASRVFWQVAGATGIGAESSFAGTIMSVGAITVGASAQLAGRALSYGTVTLAENRIG